MAGGCEGRGLSEKNLVGEYVEGLTMAMSCVTLGRLCGALLDGVIEIE